MNKFETYKLGNYCKITTGSKNVNDGNKMGEYPFFTCAQEISRSSSFSFDTEAILIAGNGDVGTLHYCNGKFEAYQRTYVLTDFENISPKYLWSQLSFSLKKSLNSDKIGTTLSYIKINNLIDYKFLAPKDEKEQNKIVEALDSIENNINSLKKLIFKKQLIKQGTIQNLLTGKKRLPGFNNKWDSKSMGELFKFSGGLSISRDNLGNSGYLYLHYGDIHLSNKTFVNLEKEFNNLPRFDTDKVPKNKLLNHGDIVFVDASEDLDGVNKHWVVENPKNIPFIAGSHTLVARNSTNMLNIDFTKYCFLLEKVKKQFQTYAVGTKVSGVNKTSIKKIILSFPVDLNEQKAIANVLLAMDKELDGLNLKLEKLKLLKQGMEEQLLTGKIRLSLN